MKKILLLFVLIMMLCLGGCEYKKTNADNEQQYPLKIWKQNSNGMCSTWTVEDEETGVEYIVVTTWYSGGYADGRSCCITPRLNADGSLYKGE